MNEKTRRTEVVSTIDFALTFPTLPMPTVDRSYLIDTIDSIFDAGMDCVFLEGPEEIGKTVLCAQFAQRYSQKSFCLFIRQFSDLASDAAQIRFDLADQIHWYLKGTRIDPVADVTPDEFRALMLVLQRKIRNQKGVAYFVLDGIDSLCESSPSLRTFFFATLPIGFAGFKFIFSGSPEQVPELSRKRLKFRSHTVSPFTLNDSQLYFSELKLSSDFISEIHRTLRGIPGRLASIKRLLEAGISEKTVLDAAEGSTDFLLPEWRCIDEGNQLQVDVLGAIAFLPECINIAKLADLLGCDSAKLIETIRSITFLELSEDSCFVTFVSDSFQRYVRRKLSANESKLVDRAINFLHRSPETGDALRLLPNYLARNKKLSELAMYLDTRRIVAATKALHSVSEVLGRLENIQRKSGLDAHDPLVLRCAIARPVLSELMWSDQLNERIEASLALKKDAVAIALANSRELDEQRLLLLTIVARAQRARGIDPDPSLVDEIRRLVESIDFSKIGERAIDIAANLALVAPDMATKALDAFSGDGDHSNAFDQAIVKLSFMALRSAKDDAAAFSVFAQVDKLARKDSTRKFARTAAVLWKKDDVDAVLNELSTFNGTSEKLFFVRQWLSINWKQAAAVGVALGAYKLLLSDTAYAPNATLFRDLALPLVSASQSDDSLRLLSFLDGQSEQARNTGPLIDYFRMRFRMAVARAKWFSEGALPGLEDDALSIESITDISVRASCYAWLVRCLRDIGLGTTLQDKGGLQSFSESGMTETINALLKGTADQIEAIRGVLVAISDIDLVKAMNIADLLNTEERVNDAYELIGDSLLNNMGVHIDLQSTCAAIRSVMSKITSKSLQQKLAVKYLVFLADHADDVLDLPSTLQPISYAVGYVVDPDLKVRSIARLLSGIAKDTNIERFSKPLVEILSNSWKEIEDDSIKASAGSDAIVSLAKTHIEMAEQLAKETNAFIEPRLARLDSQRIWRSLVILQGRSLAALAAVRAAKRDDIYTLRDCSQNVLSQIERATLLSHCALLVNQFDKEMAKLIISDYVAPIVGELIAGDAALTTELRRMLIDTSPAIWINNQATALNIIRNLKYRTRHAVLNSLLAFVISGNIPREPWSNKFKFRRPLSESIVDEALSLLEQVTDDAIFSKHTGDILDSVRDQKASARLNQNQKAHLIKSLRDMAARKLPAPRGIKHHGWKILTEARLLAAEGEKKQPDWEILVQQAKDIPNISDACYVLTFITALVPKRLDTLRNRCFKEVELKWRMLPTLEERMLRFDTIFEECGGDYPAQTRALLQQCLREFSAESSTSLRSRFKAMVEVAHKIDEEWAASLVSVTDEDPARALIKAEARERLEQIELEKRISKDETNFESKDSTAEIGRACWNELGVLNASRATSKDFDSIFALIERASNGALTEAFPILSYALASLAVKYSNNEVVSDRVRAIHTAILDAVQIVSLTIASPPVGESAQRVAELLDESESVFEIIAEPGTRHQALGEISKWLRSVNPGVLDIIDPYFRPTDIEMLTLIKEGAPNCHVRILTSIGAQLKECSGSEEFRAEVSRQLERLGNLPQIPPTVIYLVGRSSDGHMGIHDRWWLTDSAGLEHGSSFNGLGMDKTSKVRALDAKQVARLRIEVDPYFQLLKRSHAGERLSYSTILI